MRNILFIVGFILSFSAQAEEDCRTNAGLKEVFELNKQVESICQGPSVELLKVDLDIGPEGWLKAVLNPDGSIKSLQFKYDVDVYPPLSIDDLNKGQKIKLEYPAISSKNPIEIGLNKKQIPFDSQKGGDINLKIMMSPTPSNMLTGTRIKYYQNYPLKISKINGQWKVLRKNKPVNDLVLKAKKTWTWDAAYQSVQFK